MKIIYFNLKSKLSSVYFIKGYIDTSLAVLRECEKINLKKDSLEYAYFYKILANIFFD
jgi:hypothetical protein